MLIVNQIDSHIIIMLVFKSILIIVAVITAHARHFETSFKFSLFGRNDGWMFIDKMTFAPGKAQITFQTNTSGIPYGQHSNMFLTAVPQDRWLQQQIDRCRAPIRMPLAVHDVTLDGTKTFSTFTIEIEEYTTYYFVLKDCQKRYFNDYNNTNLSLYVNLHMLNNDKEMGQQEDHWYIVPFIIGAGAFLISYYMRQPMMRAQLDWCRSLLFIGVCTQISSLIWKTFGFVIYYWTGSDYFLFHLVYLLLHSTSESAMISLITLIAYGWTLTFNSGKTFELFLPAVACMFVANVLITLVTKIGHQHDRHHVFDNVGGSILITLRIIILLIFIFGAIKTYRQVRYSLKKFMKSFMLLGAVYIGAMPVIVLIANKYFDPKNRHQFVFIAVEITKFIANMLSVYEINSKESGYNQVNYKNRSFIPQDQQGFK